MLNTIRPRPTLSRSSTPLNPETPQIPTIRFTSPTPGISSTSNTPHPPLQSILAPVSSNSPRKRLVPKKSKLSLFSNKDKENDFSDVVRRVGGGSTKGGFDIYVDSMCDPDVGDIVMVKKQKSRVGLNNVSWGGGSVLGEVNKNTLPSSAGQEKTKKDKEEKEGSGKWWTIGRGRKDSKEKKEKTKSRVSSPEPTTERTRFNSLDSTTLLTSTLPAPKSSLPPAPQMACSHTQPLPQQIPLPPDDEPLTSPRSQTPTPSMNGFLCPPPIPHAPATNSGSIAIRAIRSVRSLARIGGWAQTAGEDENGKDKNSTIKEKPKKSKSSSKTSGVGKPATVRAPSTSSFEVGALSPVKKKASILGLGWASTMRAATSRQGSAASSVLIGPPMPLGENRLSVDSGNGRGRSGSVLSNSSSLRPSSTISATSGLSHASGGSSAASVRWDEGGLKKAQMERVKERERLSSSESVPPSSFPGNGKRDSAVSEVESTTSKGSRRSKEGRRRGLVSEVFGAASALGPVPPTPPPQEPLQPAFVLSPRTVTSNTAPLNPKKKMQLQQRGFPIVRVESATADGHTCFDEDEDFCESGGSSVLSTPQKVEGRRRPRPMSEQLLKRPKGVVGDGDVVMNLLDAATKDLALLIGHLDLEATPGTPDLTPLRPFPLNRTLSASASFSVGEIPPYSDRGSPVKKRGNVVERETSMSSLRPYAQSRSPPNPTKVTHFTNLEAQKSHAAMIGQQITPWAHLNAQASVSPSPRKQLRIRSKDKGLPSVPPQFKLGHKRTFSPAPEGDSSPVFHALRPRVAKRALGPEDLALEETPLSEEGKRRGGLWGTPGSFATFGARSGGSLASSLRVRGEHAEEQGSPSPSPVFRRVAAGHGHVRKRSSLVPLNHVDHVVAERESELAVIGSAGEEDTGVHGGDEDTMSMKVTLDSPPDSPVSAPATVPVVASPSGVVSQLALPTIFRTSFMDDEESHADIESSEDDNTTKKSFDFTGELRKLNESGGSDRRSFVEQLENAFRTPAKFDLGLGLLGASAAPPPVPAIPTVFVDLMKEESSVFDYSSADAIVDCKEPTLLAGSDSLGDANLSGFPMFVDEGLSSSQSSKRSDGELNTEFKFGGLPKPKKDDHDEVKLNKPLNLSDIIPPASHVRKLSNATTLEADDSALQSIFAKITDKSAISCVELPRARVDSTCSFSHDDSRIAPSKRPISGVSFQGMDSFDEVRRGFEFHDQRPSFFPPPVPSSTIATRRFHGRQESMFSIASVSSYGATIHNGSADPFDYGIPMPSLRERPSSEDMSSISMSLTVDDTFAFLNRDPARRRVESDASSFYFKAPSVIRPYKRGHRRQDSAISVTNSMGGPPISLYNRSFGGNGHKRTDSDTSANSMALSYAVHGARAGWAKHSREESTDSIMSDFSAMHLGRPGLGDKMFDQADYSGMPLTAISASPNSISSKPAGDRTSCDSIMDERRSSADEDSIFDDTGDRSSISSASVFGYDGPQVHLFPPNHFRPLSMYSEESTRHSPKKDDDTMISMLGGGHVRRRSVDVDASPCPRAHKRKHAVAAYPFNAESPKKTRIIEKPSIASTMNSFKFGGERMIRARHGLLERQSLEEHCLSAEGEDLSLGRIVPVFSRPMPTGRSRSSTCTSSSSGVDTPPLSCSEGTQSEGSISSIDLSHLNYALVNTTYPSAGASRARARVRAKGQGHRRPLSKANMSRSSVYETIEEELGSVPPSPARITYVTKENVNASPERVYIVQPDDASVHSLLWDDEQGITNLRKYYALRDEAVVTVEESKKIWEDTPFSIFALQSFYPPHHPDGMQALLVQSQQSYGPLPRRIRSRTSSRASPYPQERVRKVSITHSPERLQPTFAELNRSSLYNVPPIPASPLKSIAFNTNVARSPRITKAQKGGVSPDNLKGTGNVFGPPQDARPRVPSGARRTALGWSKRSNGPKMSTERKENVSQGNLMTPGESLRINRPRPRGRPTPASARPIRF